MKESKKLLIIAGPTATGKTLTAKRLAQLFQGELVSADSRQVYRGMDIGTGKDLPKEAKNKLKKEKIQLNLGKFGKHQPYRFDEVPVWLLDIVEPDYLFSVADWLACAQLVIDSIWSRGKLPIVVGGTGFYLKSLLHGIDSLGVKPDWDLRKRLGKYSLAQLQVSLKEKDLERWRMMNRSDRANPRRLVRAIEVSLNKSLKNNDFARNGRLNRQKLNCLKIALVAPRLFLDRKIKQRVDRRVSLGVKAEVKTLLSKGYSWQNSALGRTLGYQQWEPLFRLNNDPSGFSQEAEAEAVGKWKKAERLYARRQMTWLKKQAQYAWFDVSQGNWQVNLEKEVRKWYHQNNVKQG